MPLSKKDRDMEQSFERRYGNRGKRVYYATLQKRISEGRPIDSPESRKLSRKRKRKETRNRKRGH